MRPNRTYLTPVEHPIYDILHYGAPRPCSERLDKNPFISKMLTRNLTRFVAAAITEILNPRTLDSVQI